MQTTTIEITWGTSRGRDTYGYTTCTLREHGKRLAACNGGGYDMRGTVLGSWLASRFADRLLKLTPAQMPKNSHWERAETPRRLCTDIGCMIDSKGEARYTQDLTCPRCGKETREDHRDGKTVDDGRYFYGLTFHDPNYNPRKAKLEHPDGTFTTEADKGKTFEELEKEGKIVGLDVYRAFYQASSKVPTKTHTVPLIDGACGVSCVEAIGRAIGVTFEQTVNRSKLDVYTVHISDRMPAKKAA